MNYLPPLASAPNTKAARIGFLYWAFSFCLLGSLISLITALVGLPLSSAQLNFICYSVNFAVAVLIFREFLWENWKTAADRIFPTLYYAILAYLGSQLFLTLVNRVILAIRPDFGNVNDESIHAMLAQAPGIMVLGAVVLAPVAEEIFYRGIFFRKLFDVKPWLGYLASMLVFAAVHTVGYIGSVEPALLMLGFLQYLPAGYCLCWCYRQTGTILSPILMHMLFNASSILSLVR